MNTYRPAGVAAALPLVFQFLGALGAVGIGASGARRYFLRDFG